MPLLPWLLTAGFFSLVVAMSAAILKGSTGAQVAESVLFGGGAFATTIMISLGVLVIVRDWHKGP
ncbi:hypothetical protein LO772_18960 [Yinghuangia sp. ASG 101]|uniref:hypothetical protein n=1 Tax=Yinghuangia sp. ASG 101 TaxID=2896848 RepID=UPI001E31F911|nr:hypothetical protein [Yinghuangia sp. ASG 101]UGQ09052.1 hypothetical protein LO772_18960 [Yinghuangia sp. ASG 101]